MTLPLRRESSANKQLQARADKTLKKSLFKLSLVTRIKRDFHDPDLDPKPSAHDPWNPSISAEATITITRSMLGILYTFWDMGFLISMKKGSFFLLGVMWAKIRQGSISYAHLALRMRSRWVFLT